MELFLWRRCLYLILIKEGLWYLTPLSTIFQLYRGGQFHWRRKPEYPRNHRPIASHWQILSHNVVSSTPRLSGVRTHNINGNRHCIAKVDPTTIRSRPQRPAQKNSIGFYVKLSSLKSDILNFALKQKQRQNSVASHTSIIHAWFYRNVLNGFGENTVEYNYHSNLFGGSSQKWIFSLVHNHKY